MTDTILFFINDFTAEIKLILYTVCTSLVYIFVLFFIKPNATI